MDSPAAGPAPTEGRPGDHPGEAPRYQVASRSISAVEVPANVQNIDRAVRAYGRTETLSHVLNPTRYSIPLYLNPDSPFCSPILSHNAPCHSVVLKLAVPKRTGRRKKRGTTEPWEGDVDVPDHKDDGAPKVASNARQDSPALLRQKLQDTVGQHTVEAVGIIKNAHRFRGLADFYWDMSESRLAQDFVNKALPGDAVKLRDFKFEPGTDAGPNVDIVPPPIFTQMSLPFNYNYSQNPYVRTTATGATVNTTAVRQIGYFIAADDPAPTGPQHPPNMTDARTVEVIARLEEAFDERPVWTRRSLLNHLSGQLQSWNELKKYLNYVAYQFKGGPWRDGVVPYGIDPRTDPKYRIYQTLMFKMEIQRKSNRPQTWTSVRRDQDSKSQTGEPNSHVFDGEVYHTDGKVWQVCDITDPLLKELLDSAAVRSSCDSSSGWYHGGRWAKIKAIMKTKLVGIQFGRSLTRADFAATLRFGDMTPTSTSSSNFHIPLPNLHLTKEELTKLHGREPAKKKSHGYNVRMRSKLDTSSVAPSSAPGSPRPSSPADANSGLQRDENEEEADSEIPDYEPEDMDEDDGLDQDEDTYMDMDDDDI